MCLGFVTMAYLFFGNFLVRYRTVFQTQQSLFNMLLGKFSFEELIEVDETLGAIFFMSYSNCMMMITMNIFVVILDASVGDVNEGLAEKSNEYEIVSFMLGRLKYWVRETVGSAKQTVHDISKPNYNICKYCFLEKFWPYHFCTLAFSEKKPLVKYMI